jgi:hypothetical protein
VIWGEFFIFAAVLTIGVWLFQSWGVRRFPADPNDDRPSLGFGVFGRWVVVVVGVVVFIVGLASGSPAGILGGLTIVAVGFGEHWVYRNDRRR